MGNHLFIVRSPSGKEIYSAEIPIETNLISMAHTLMDVVRGEFTDVVVECCEIWCRTEHQTMTLLATAF